MSLIMRRKNHFILDTLSVVDKVTLVKGKNRSVYLVSRNLEIRL